MTKFGTAYVDIVGDLSPITKQAAGLRSAFGRSLGQLEGAAKSSFARIGGSANQIGVSVRRQSGTVDGSLRTIQGAAGRTSQSLAQIGGSAGQMGGTVRAQAGVVGGALGTIQGEALQTSEALGGIDGGAALGAVQDEAAQTSDALSGVESEAGNVSGALQSVDQGGATASLQNVGSQALQTAEDLGEIGSQADSTGGSLSGIQGSADQSATALEQMRGQAIQTGHAVEHLGGATDQGARAAVRSSRVHTRLKESFQGAGASVRRLAGGLLVAVSAYRAYSAAKTAISVTTELAKATLQLHRNTGLDIESSSRWAAIMQARGASASTLATAFGSLSKNVVAANKGGDKQRAAFRELGITTDDLKAGTQDFEGLLGKVADGFGKLKGGVDRAAVAQAIFGRGGRELIPIFSEGNKGLQEQLRLADKYHVTFGGKSVKSIQQLIRAEKELKFAQLGLQTQFTQLLAPALTGALKKVNDFAREISGVMSRTDLTPNEKWNRIGGLIGGKLEAALPQIAEAAGRMGPRVALGFIRGFIKADAWGKVAIGAFLVHKIFGIGNLFKAAGGRLVRSFASTFVPAMEAEGATGTLAAARASAASAPAFTASGAEAGTAWGRGFRTTAAASSTLPIPVGGPRGTPTRTPPRTPAPAPVPVPTPVPKKPGGLVRGAGRLLGKLALPVSVALVLEPFAKPELEKLDKQLKEHGRSLTKFHVPVFGDIETNPFKLFGGKASEAEKAQGKIAEAFKGQAGSIKEVTARLGELGQAHDREKSTAAAVESAQHRVNTLRKEGKTGTHEYAEALRALDDAEGAQLQNQARLASARSKAAQAAKADVSAARQALATARDAGLSQTRLSSLSHRVAQARSREAAALANVERVQRGLTPVTGHAATQMGVLLKTLRGVEGFSKFKKFTLTADVGSVNKAVGLVSKLQGLGRVKTALRIIADSKTPEEALRRLREKLHQLEARAHKIKVEAEDEATRKLDRLRHRINTMPNAKITVDVVGGRMSVATKLERKLSEAFTRAGQGQAGKAFHFKAKGGKVGAAEHLTLVGEEGKEIAFFKGAAEVVGQKGAEIRSFPADTEVFSHPESKRIAKRLGIPGFARGGVVGRRRRPEEDPPPEERRGKTGQRLEETGAAQAASRRDTKAEKSAKPSGRSILQRADRLDRARLPYKWGGNHALPYNLGDGFDCSSAVSYVLNIAPRTSGQLAGYGSPGKGPVTVFANPKHTFLSIFGRGFGTSPENPGKGPGWLSYSSRSGFAISHLANVAADEGDGKGAEKKRPRRFRHLSLGQYVTVAKQVGFPDPALAAAIFYAESKGNVGAENHTTKEWSLGGAQINVQAHEGLNNPTDRKKLQEDIFFNFREAKKISHGGKNFTPWTMFTNKQYKQYLGAGPKALPGRESTPAKGSSLAEYLAFKLEEAEFKENVQAQYRWINRGQRYWRKVLRRSKASGNRERARSALQELTSLRDAKRALRKEPEDTGFKLGDLSTLSAGTIEWNIAGLQPTLDRLQLDIANAALTETLDAAGNVTPASFADDIDAATRYQKVWQDIYDLASGKAKLNLVMPAPQPKKGEPRVHKLSNGKYAAKVGKKTYTFSGTPGQEITVGGKKTHIPADSEFVPRPGTVMGTVQQQIEAANSLKDARDALRSIQDEAKSEAVSPEAAVAAEAAPNVNPDIPGFSSAWREIIKNFARNFAPLQSFAGGGIVQGPQGKPITIEGHGGELVFDPRTKGLTITREEGKPAVSRPTKVVLHEYNGPVTQVQPDTDDIHHYMRTEEIQLRAAMG